MKPMAIPTVRQVARELRDANRYYDGPATVALWIHTQPHQALHGRSAHILMADDNQGPCDGPSIWWKRSAQVEQVPGDGRRFDAMAAARRLLAGLP